MEQYESLCNMASEVHAYAPDARVLTTYYCGKISCSTLLSFPLTCQLHLHQIICP